MSCSSELCWEPPQLSCCFSSLVSLSLVWSPSPAAVPGSQDTWASAKWIFLSASPVAFLCPGRARLPRAVLCCLSVCLSVLVCAGSSCWLCWLVAFPCAVLGPRGSGAARGVTSPAPLGALQGLPHPSYSSYLFIEMSECDEVQKSKLFS